MVGPSMPPSSNLMCWRNRMMISVLGKTKSFSNTLPFFHNSQDIKTLQLLLSLSLSLQNRANQTPPLHFHLKFQIQEFFHIWRSMDETSLKGV
ncbi:hypothetical protein HanXRQr2_Chr17g0813201 [Helianthus annuus]|uniref:Uncharacterized protein n=1 Tax=Helianthus annuus TaxID=4232 RepID=A0A9K3DLI2_HELAN|nr:hypothetical protein HanXRQr2_Chr17g0813201 [Helianthus annuus]